MISMQLALDFRWAIGLIDEEGKRGPMSPVFLVWIGVLLSWIGVLFLPLKNVLLDRSSIILKRENTAIVFKLLLI